MPSGPVVPPINDAAVDALALRRQLRARADAEPPWLHGEVATRMAARLPLFRQRPERVLQWWPRVGGGHDDLQAACPQARMIHVVPTSAATRHEGLASSPASIQRNGPKPKVPEAASWWQRLRHRAPGFSVIDDDAVPADSGDMLWANMVLHAAPDRRAMVEAWHSALSMDGLLMMTTLGPDTARELREIYRAAGWGTPGATLIDMHDVGDDLVRAGFADPVMDQETLTLTWPDVESMLRELRTLGRNASPHRHAGLRTPRWRRDFADRLSSTAVGGRIALTFEVVYGHAFKARRGSTTVGLDELRGTLPSRRQGRR